MGAWTVEYSTYARQDLADLLDFLLLNTSPNIATDFVERILSECESLALSPMRGTLRGGRQHRLRTIEFEKRVTILFLPLRAEKRVIVLGVLYGGRDLEAMLLRRAKGQG